MIRGRLCTNVLQSSKNPDSLARLAWFLAHTGDGSICRVTKWFISCSSCRSKLIISTTLSSALPTNSHRRYSIQSSFHLNIPPAPHSHRSSLTRNTFDFFCSPLFRCLLGFVPFSVLLNESVVNVRMNRELAVLSSTR